MPSELLILIVLFAIPVVAGCISGFTSNTMTQNNIPSMTDYVEVQSEDQQWATWEPLSSDGHSSNPYPLDRVEFEMNPLSEKINLVSEGLESEPNDSSIPEEMNPSKRVVSTIPEEVDSEIHRFLRQFKKEEPEIPFNEDPHDIDQMLRQMNHNDVPPLIEESLEETPLSQKAFKAIAKNYGTQVASRITTTPAMGPRFEEDTLIGRLRF